MNLLTRVTKGAGDRSRHRVGNRLQTYFLDRFARLQRLRDQATAASADQERKLIDHALYSTYWDCVALGMRDEAQQALRLLAAARLG